MKQFLTILFILISYFTNAQVNDSAIRQQVLSKGVTDSTYVFGMWDGDTGTETHLRYLGVVETAKGNYKILTSMFIWGLSQRATNRILIFDENNDYVGEYAGLQADELPYKSENNSLYFLYDDEKKCTVVIDFSKGIPEMIFLNCDGRGDMYYFSKAD